MNIWKNLIYFSGFQTEKRKSLKFKFLLNPIIKNGALETIFKKFDKFSLRIRTIFKQKKEFNK